MNKFRANPTDLIIVIMGPTGSGKTNFINTLTKNAEKAKAALLSSATQNVTPYTIPHHDLRLVLVDTPGFDDTYRPDMEILQMIAAWITKKYPDGTTLRLTGIIYLHRITDNRMSGSAYRNLQIFGRLCGNLPLRRARLVTTMWDTVKDHQLAGDRREKQLVDEFWQPLIQEGATVKRFYNTSSSASEIVNELIDANIPKVTLLLQEELIEQQKRLNETEAGRVVYSRLQNLLAEQRRTLKELADEAKLQNDPDLARSLQEEYDEIGVQLQDTFQEMERMKISLPRRFILWLYSLGKSPGKAVKLDNSPL